MSWTEVVSLHPNAPLRLGYYLLAAIMCCALAMPIGILWTKLLVIKTPPIEMAPIAEEPVKNAPSLSSPAETVTREAPPSAVLPREGVPAESAPSADAPTAGVPTVTVPTQTLPGETPSALLPRLEDIPDITTIPSSSASLPIVSPSGKRAEPGGVSAHAQVVALMNLLARKKAGVRHTAPAAKSSTANSGTQSRSVYTTPRPPANSVKTAAADVGANSIDHRGPGPGVLGGPATSSASSAGLNGTGIQHRR